MNFKYFIAENISKVVEEEAESIVSVLSVPPDEKMGDVAFPCFVLAKKMKCAPPIIAEKIKTSLISNGLILGQPDSFLERIEVVGGYLNFYFNRRIIAKVVLTEIIRDGDNYAKSDEGKGKKVLVEFSSPNIAKPFHIGHLVSTALGSSIEKIHSFLGYDTVKINHLGDWGTQFGKLISAYKHWGDAEVIEKDPINELLNIYVKFHKEEKENPELEDEARNYFRLLEEGDPEVTALWKFFVDASIKEFKRMYNMLQISFDSYAGESFYSDKMPAIIDELNAKKLLEESEGAKVVRFEDESIPPSIIIKSDGSTIYATRDIAAAFYRKNHYDFYKNIYVVGTPQALHFKQVFGVIEKMGYDWWRDCVHVGFGYVRFPEKKMSTRQGDIVLLEDVLREAVDKTRDIIVSSPTCKIMEDLEDVSRKIGVGAVLFAFLKNGRERDIIFTWDDMLDFEGESGPYVQYSYARGKSVLRKAAELNLSCEEADLSLLCGDEEFSIIKMMNRFSDVVHEAALKNEPSCITRFIIDLAQQFNKFYNNCNIMKSDPELQKARLVLTASACTCLKSGLALLGVDVVEQM